MVTTSSRHIVGTGKHGSTESLRRCCTQHEGRELAARSAHTRSYHNLRNGLKSRDSDTAHPPVTVVTIANIVTMLLIISIVALAALLNAKLGLTSGDLGIAIGAFFCLQAVRGIPSARLADRHGVHMCLLASAAGTAVVLLSYAHAAHDGFVIIALSGAGGVLRTWPSRGQRGSGANRTC